MPFYPDLSYRLLAIIFSPILFLVSCLRSSDNYHECFRLGLSSSYFSVFFSFSSVSSILMLDLLCCWQLSARPIQVHFLQGAGWFSFTVLSGHNIFSIYLRHMFMIDTNVFFLVSLWSVLSSFFGVLIPLSRSYEIE